MTASALTAAELYAARPAVKAEAAPTPALAAALSDSARACITARRLCAPLDGAVLAGVLSPSECGVLRTEAASLGFSFWAPERSADASAFRSADTVEVTCPEVAAALWERVRKHLPSRLVLGDGRESSDDGAVERGLAGTWEACGVNDVLLFSRYRPGGHFSPHTDGNTVVDLNTRSLYSLLVYLNTCGGGGETTLFVPPPDAPADCTRLFSRDGAARLRWPPAWAADAAAAVEGSVLCFRQDVAHEGAPVHDGCEKLIIRTDLMFRRVPPLCDDGAGREAYRLWGEANEAEAAGEAMRAMGLFRQSARASPEFASLMGL